MSAFLQREIVIPFPSVIRIACVIAVLSYILFNVLDVDGSNRGQLDPATAYALATEHEGDAERAHLQPSIELWADILSCSMSRHSRLFSSRRTQEDRPLGFKLARYRRRVSLPRSSIPNPARMPAPAYVTS